MKIKLSVPTKIFIYTLLLVLLICLAAVFLFSRDFLSFYRAEQRRMLDISYRPIISVIMDRTNSPEDILEYAKEFADNNQSFRFFIQEGDGHVMFATDNLSDFPENSPELGIQLKFSADTNRRLGPEGSFRSPGLIMAQGVDTERNFTFTGYNLDSGNIDYGNLLKRSFLAIGLMLVIAVAGAVFFAKKVTKPLEEEIARERAIEENQRLFFSAASHELKTPIAAARALVEGMIAGVGDYRDHQKYLRECLKTFDAQTHLVSEILDIVKLSNKETIPASFAQVNLAELGNTVLTEYLPLAEKKNIKIEGEFPSVNVHTDWNLLKLVLSNVMSNAIQNTAENEAIKIYSYENKDLRVCILNTGAHIPVDLISRLFEPFYTLDSARTNYKLQSGLGLTIVKKALDSIKIPFALENTSEGVLFWMDLPVSSNFRKTSGKVQ